MIKVLTADIRQRDILEMVPHAGIQRVEVRRVAGQALEDEVPGRRCFLKGAHGPEAVDGRAVPDDQELAGGPVGLQTLDEGHAIEAVERVVICPV